MWMAIHEVLRDWTQSRRRRLIGKGLSGRSQGESYLESEARLNRGKEGAGAGRQDTQVIGIKETSKCSFVVHASTTSIAL